MSITAAVPSDAISTSSPTLVRIFSARIWFIILSLTVEKEKTADKPSNYGMYPQFCYDRRCSVGIIFL